MASEQKQEQKSSKVSRLWIIGSDGKPSMSATFATVAFMTTTVIYIASIFEKIGPLSVRPFDPAVCATYLTPVLALYFGRRATESKVNGPSTGGSDQ